MSTTPIGCDGDDWFARLCESHGVEPAPPIIAAQLTDRHALFTTTGHLRLISRVRLTDRSVSVRYVGGGYDLFAPSMPISLVALAEDRADA